MLSQVLDWPLCHRATETMADYCSTVRWPNGQSKPGYPNRRDVQESRLFRETDNELLSL